MWYTLRAQSLTAFVYKFRVAKEPSETLVSSIRAGLRFHQTGRVSSFINVFSHYIHCSRSVLNQCRIEVISANRMLFCCLDTSL